MQMIDGNGKQEFQYGGRLFYKTANTLESKFSRKIAIRNLKMSFWANRLL